MVWFKVDDGLVSALKTTRIPRARRAAAMGLWVLSGSWAARELTDGFIPAHMLMELACSKRMAADLVEAGFWDVVEGGYQFHNWSVYNPDAASVGSARSAMTDGGLEGNHRRWHVQRGRKASGCVWCFPDESETDRKPESPTDRVPDSGAESGANPPVPVPVPVPVESASHSPARETLLGATDEVESSFDRAWKDWPKKDDRRTALARYKTAIKIRGGLDLLEADVIRFGNAYARAADEIRFVPGLATWLNKQRWNDDLPVASVSRTMTRTEQNLAVVAQLQASENAGRPTRDGENMAVIRRLEAREQRPHTSRTQEHLDYINSLEVRDTENPF